MSVTYAISIHIQDCWIIEFKRLGLHQHKTGKIVPKATSFSFTKRKGREGTRTIHLKSSSESKDDYR